MTELYLKQSIQGCQGIVLISDSQKPLKTTITEITRSLLEKVVVAPLSSICDSSSVFFAFRDLDTSDHIWYLVRYFLEHLQFGCHVYFPMSIQRSRIWGKKTHVRGYLMTSDVNLGHSIKHSSGVDSSTLFPAARLHVTAPDTCTASSSQRPHSLRQPRRLRGLAGWAQFRARRSRVQGARKGPAATAAAWSLLERAVTPPAGPLHAAPLRKCSVGRRLPPRHGAREARARPPAALGSGSRARRVPAARLPVRQAPTAACMPGAAPRPAPVASCSHSCSRAPE
ncbi:hypothetical protein H8959_014626 [Pygathrix nigripes]